MSIRITLGGKPSLHGNLAAYGYGRETCVAFFSAFGYFSHMSEIQKELNFASKGLTVDGRYFNTGRGKEYETFVTRLTGSDYAHIIAYKKDSIIKNERTQEETINGFIFWNSETKINLKQNDILEYSQNNALPKELIDGFYDKIYKMSPLPVIKEWSNYLIGKLASNGQISQLIVVSTDEDCKFTAFTFSARVSQLRDYISEGLQSGEIVISQDHNEVSETMREIAGLDAYLNEFRDTLAARIQDSFVPRFIPGEDEYSQTLKDIAEYGSYMGKLSLYETQKSVVQAAANALRHKKAAFIIGEAGVGKTATSISAVLTHNEDKRTMTNVVMCPGHLVEKWRREILRLAPNSDAVIVSDFDDLVSVVPEIKNKDRRRHLWLVLSKETAKFGYQERPVAVWNSTKRASSTESRGVYCCPECGQPLYSKSYAGHGRWRTEIRTGFGFGAFSKKTATNAVCMNEKRIWNEKTSSYESVSCGAKLWSATGKYEKPFDIGGASEESPWVNLGAKVGWIERNKIQTEFDRITGILQPEKEDAAKLSALSDAISGEIPAQRAPIKYPLGKYFRKYLKGYIDYALFDEIHELKGRDSLQGQAFGDLLRTARHSLCFTGTLLNGYASGIFYILYRAFPGLMKSEGFDFGISGEQEFVKQYGVYRQVSRFSYTGNRQGNQIGGSSIKQLPGVSPIVFTKFLLENAVFVSLEDIDAGLPGYEEIPVPVDMDPELANAYNEIEATVHNRGFNRVRNGMKTMAQAVQLLTIFPDQPFGQPPVIHPDTGDVVISPPDLSAETSRNKETEFVRLVREKVEEGQKVLVYYHWTNRTELGTKLRELLEAEGINAVTMGSNVSSRKREAWVRDRIEKDNIDVLICNPSLVETGLDLLDFTTIVYYQVGYNLFTLRQSSRRSWRLSQTKDVQVYFLYYRNTVQEQALSLMATKLQAAMSIEGKFSEEGLNALSNNEDILTKIAASVADGIKDTLDAQVFTKTKVESAVRDIQDNERMIDIPRKISMISIVDGIRKRVKRKGIPVRACNIGEEDVLEDAAEIYAAI